MIMSITILAFTGLLVSLYAFFVEQKIKDDPSYKPVCDLSDKISCSKPILSPYGKLIKISNTILGMFFYTFIILLSWYEYTTLIFYSALVSVAISIYLAYILYTKIKSLCLICTSIYLINLALLIFSYLNL